MRGSFTRKGRKCEVTVTKSQFKGTVKNSQGPSLQWNIQVDDVLAVHQSDVSSVVVHYVTPGNKGLLTWSKLVLTGEPDMCKELHNSLNSALPERLKPKHFLVVINPVSGKKIGSRIFHKKVAPLLRICNITYQVYETKGPNDACNAFSEVNFSELDGLLVVGGDGHYSDVLRALVDAYCQQTGTGDVTSSTDLRLPPIPFPLGIIPGGTGNYVVNYLHGSKDPVTAAIKIVLGHTLPTNLVSVLHGDTLVGYGGLICAFGLIGDMIHSCEQARWMGPLRYKVMPVKRLLSRQTMDLDVAMRREAGDWETVSGQFYSVDTGVVNLHDSGSELVPVFSDSALTLHLTSECSLGDHVKQLTKVDNWTTGAWEYSFVTSHRVQEYRITQRDSSSADTDSRPDRVQQTGGSTSANEVTAHSASATSGQTSRQTTASSSNTTFYLNLDGEAIPISEALTIRLHRGVISLFGSK